MISDGVAHIKEEVELLHYKFLLAEGDLIPGDEEGSAAAEIRMRITVIFEYCHRAMGIDLDRTSPLDEIEIILPSIIEGEHQRSAVGWNLHQSVLDIFGSYQKETSLIQKLEVHKQPACRNSVISVNWIADMVIHKNRYPASGVIIGRIRF